jgi:hypothetical protein
MNRLTPQADAIFEARLQELILTLERDATQIKQQHNARGVFYSSSTVQVIYSRVDAAISDMAKIASDCPRLAYEAGDHKFSRVLENELLDAFELNLSNGYKQLLALRMGLTQQIRDGLLNKSMHEPTDVIPKLERLKLEGQLVLRKYFQEIKNKQKTWLGQVKDAVKYVVLLLAALFRGP